MHTYIYTHNIYIYVYIYISHLLYIPPAQCQGAWKVTVPLALTPQ